MRAHLVAGLRELRRELGDAFLDQLTYPGIFRAAPQSVTPVLVEWNGRRTVIINDADSQSARVLPNGVSTIRYGRYFTWDDDRAGPVLSFGEAVRQAAGNAALLCDPSIPQARYEAIAAEGPVELKPLRPPEVFFVYRKAIDEIEAQWRTTREADWVALEPYIAQFPHGAELTGALYARAEGFRPLRQLCCDRNIDALCVTSPYEVEVLTGLPDSLNDAYGLVAIYQTGSDSITICAQKPLERADFVPVGNAQPLFDILSGLGAVGAQKSHMSAGLWNLLTAAGAPLVDCDPVLRRWQDFRAGDDFGYFLFAGNAVIEGMAAARAFFERMQGSALTECDLLAAHHEGVRRFARRFGFEGRISPYFGIVHSGARTLLPATAADYPVFHDDLTIAFDTGIIMRDAAGCARAVSDIARTACRTPELTAVYNALRAALIEQLIPQIRPGLTGEQIHRIGVDCLRPLEAQLRAAGLLPATKGVGDYTRDCGHAIHRQTVSSVYFAPGNSETIEEGMLGCVEYVWPIGKILIGVEEGYVVLPKETVPFTREVNA